AAVAVAAPPAAPPVKAAAVLSSPAAVSSTGPTTRTADDATKVAHPEADTAPSRPPLADWGQRAGTRVREVPGRLRTVPRRWLVAAGVGVLVLLVLTLPLLPSGSDKKKAHTPAAPTPPGASTGGPPAGPAVPSATPTSTAAETPSQAPPPAGPPP